MEIYFQITEKLGGQGFDNPLETEHFGGYLLKLFSHAASAMQLAEGTKFSGLSVPVNFGDRASVLVLARAALERV